MRVTKISLATLVALGTLTCANAETALEEAIKGTTISGYAYGQYTGMFGDDADGSAFRSRVWANINTGTISGFSLGTRIFASIGQGAPNGGRFLANSGVPKDVAAFGMYSLYGKYSFEALGSKTTLMGGKLNIMTPFNDNAWDYGYGLYVSNEDIEGIKFTAQGYAAWALDNGNAMYTTLTMNSSSSIPTGNVENPASLSTQNPLFIFGVEGSKDKLAGAAFKLYAATSPDTIDYLVFGDVSYTILDTGVTLQSQVAVAGVDTDNKAFSYDYGSSWSKVAAGSDLTAKLRGLYNIQLSYANKDIGFSAKAGFTGSFGDGYGALFNYASFNMGGKFWYDTVSSYNGYGLTGVGGHKRLNADGSVDNTDIMVGYVGVQYTKVANLTLGLDYAFVGGNNNYARMVKSRENALASATSTEDFLNAFNTNATFHEVTFTASYAFIPKKLTLSGLVGSTFGDLQMGRARVNLNYSF